MKLQKQSVLMLFEATFVISTACPTLGANIRLLSDVTSSLHKSHAQIFLQNWFKLQSSLYLLYYDYLKIPIIFSSVFLSNEKSPINSASLPLGRTRLKCDVTGQTTVAPSSPRATLCAIALVKAKLYLNKSI